MSPALVLMGVYVLVTFALQVIFFGVSKVFDGLFPEWSLLIFLTLFMCAYGLAWPIAVRLTEPKTVEGALQADLATLQKQGLIRTFSVEHGKQGPFVQVTPGPNSPPDLRGVLVSTLGHMVSERSISIGT